ncbi:flagellar hook-length control protein FliK [Microbulbifer sp. SA54]|uniref:flagellar hook-length control protein FliK n=1 Tax=Microbulbifer sp. SA54 TaxID=3401577 RepID=UPI003AAE4718
MDISALLGKLPASTGQLNGTNSGNPGHRTGGEGTLSFAGTLHSAMQSKMQSAIAQTLSQPGLGTAGVHSAAVPLTNATGKLGLGEWHSGQPGPADLLERLAVENVFADEDRLEASENSGADNGLMALLAGTVQPALQTAVSSLEASQQNNSAVLRAGFAGAQHGPQLPAQTVTLDTAGEADFPTPVADNRAQPLAMANNTSSELTMAATGNGPGGQAAADSVLPATALQDPAQLAVSATTQAATSAPTSAGNLSTTPNPALAMQSPLGSSAWGAEFGQHLLNMAHRGDQQVDLFLHPRELGALTVSLSFDEQGARAQFLAASAAVRSAVEQALPQLREALAQQGISLGETSVGEHQQNPSHQQQAPAWAGNAISGREQEISPDSQPVPAAPRSVHLRGVDLYA